MNAVKTFASHRILSKEAIKHHPQKFSTQKSCILIRFILHQTW